MAMRLVCSYRGTEKIWEVAEPDFFLGRTHENSPTLLDLSPDMKISRVHARLWKGDDLFWIEDQKSMRGTLLNNVEIKGAGKKAIQTGDVVVVGDTTVRVDSLESPDLLGQTNYLELGASLARDERQDEVVNITQDVDSIDLNPASEKGAKDLGAKRLKLIFELPLLFAAKTQLSDLLPTIVDRLVDLIPNAETWALALRDPATNALLLKAYRSPRNPYVSETLSRRAMGERKALIWSRAISPQLSGTILQSAIATGMYAPLLWQGEAIGIICAESCDLGVTFVEEDLRLIVFMAQYAAMAVGSQRLQEKLRQESVLSSKLLRQFSPKIAERLLAHKGRLRLGGERSEVTILNSDIRGFTKLAKDMDPDDIVEMINEYFGVMVPIVFSHQGTIDKFMGDAILAVFGSPEPDPKQHEHAILAAIEMRAAVAKISEQRRMRDLPCADVGIGIHSGEVVHGFVGTLDRMEFTVIGDVVNKASRYCMGAAGGEILISPEMHERVWRLVQFDQITIQTKHEGNFIAYRVNSARAGAELESARS
jgi:adenylate cyclase